MSAAQAAAAPYSRIDFLGSPVDNLSLAEALERVNVFIRSRKPHQIVPQNASKLWRMNRDARLAEIVRGAHLVIPEKAIVMGAGFLGTPLKEHVGGVMLAIALLPIAAERGYRMYFLGARPHVVEEVVRRMNRDFPSLPVAGWHHGYFTAEEEPGLIASIRDSRPDILLVALGTPKQEYWIRQHMEELRVPVVMGVGGTFNVLAGLKKDTPAWLRRLALEWLYRLVQDPRNLWKRYLITIPWFLRRVLLAKCRGQRPASLPAVLDS